MAEELEQYRIHLTGEYESILPYIRDGEGHYSPEKTEEVIEELVGYVRLYHEYEADCSLREQEEMYGREWTEAGNVFPGFSEEAETFFRNFFYCALRISEAEETLRCLTGRIYPARRRRFMIFCGFPGIIMKGRHNYTRRKRWRKGFGIIMMG